MSDEQTTTEVDLITQHHHYSGLVLTRGLRLADVLSDARLGVLEIQEAVLRTEGVRPAELRCGQVFLKKRDLLLVLPKGSYEAPVRRCNYYQKKERYGAVVAMPGLLLSGVLHLPARANPWMLLDEDSGMAPFFGMTDVTVHGSIHRFAPSECDTAILRRGSIQALQLTEKPLPSQGAEKKSVALTA